MAIKVSLGKLKLPGGNERYIPEQIAANGFRMLDIAFRHVARLARFSFHHRDPFDRLLAAQALEERLAIVTAEPIFQKFCAKRLW